MAEELNDALRGALSGALWVYGAPGPGLEAPLADVESADGNEDALDPAVCASGRALVLCVRTAPGWCDT